MSCFFFAAADEIDRLENDDDEEFACFPCALSAPIHFMISDFEAAKKNFLHFQLPMR